MRLRRIELTAGFLAGLFIEHEVHPAFAVVTGVPPDAQLIHIELDNRHVGVVSLIFEHPSFPEVADGGWISPSAPAMVTFWPIPDAALYYVKDHGWEPVEALSIKQ